MLDLEILQNINFKNPEVLYCLLLLPLILYICHLNLDSIKRRSLFRDFSPKSLKFLYSRKINLLSINILRATFFTLLVLAIAEPRWDYHVVNKKHERINNLILLDVSKSMNAIDQSPNRFEHAKRKIADILSPGNDYGLVAFAKTSYNLIPITSDHDYIKDYLRNIRLNDFSSEGSNFNFSLDLIIKINQITPINQVYIISDFDFDETIDVEKLKLITDANIKLYPVNVATLKGSPIKEFNGSFLSINGQTIISKPREDIIRALNEVTEQLSQDFIKSSESIASYKVWHEKYYIFLIPLLAIFLILNKRSAFLLLILGLSFTVLPQNTLANPLLNDNQNALSKYDLELFDEAKTLFTDPYNKGVAAYRNRNYDEAIDFFSQGNDLSSQFNLANSLLLNNQIDDSIKKYEEILNNNPDHEKSQKNLEIAKKLRQQQKQQNKQDNQNQKKDKQQNNNSSKNKDNNSDNDQNSDNNPEHTNVAPRIERQDQNLTSNINKNGNNNLKNQINKNKQPAHNYKSNPW